MRGPIDYIIVGFDGGKFDGSILRAITDAIDKEIIGLIALLVVRKDEDGTVTAINVADTDDEYLEEFREKYVDENSAIDEDDLEEVADLLAEDTAAGLLVIEQLWAKPLKKAILDAKGFLIAEGRIHPKAAKELE